MKGLIVTQTTLLTLPEPKSFDIRACPIWAIPQLAELRRRLSYGKLDSAEILSFKLTAHTNPEGRHQIGEFLIYIWGEGLYYGYINSDNMNNYQHPEMYEWRW
jgi:hypothetical protein